MVCFCKVAFFKGGFLWSASSGVSLFCRQNIETPEEALSTKDCVQNLSFIIYV